MRRIVFAVLSVMALVALIVGATPSFRHRLKARLMPPRPVICRPADATASAGATSPQRYSTVFSRPEHAISEGGTWKGGKTVALDWTDVRTVPGLAFGVQIGNHQGTAQYDDSIAILSGSWPPDQSAEATVHSVDQDDSVYEEVELILRSSLASHCASGYEINFRCSKTANAYAEIVRWNGRLGDFTYLARGAGSQYGVAEGDVVHAAIAGDVITSYINGKEILRASDRAYTKGNPGMGFFLHGTRRTQGNCGFSRFSASGG